MSFDQSLHVHDIRGSHAHLDMLEATGIVSLPDAATIRGGLDRIEKEIAAGRFVFKPELEDIHMNIEARLAELVGPVAGRLHTARSRNDQVATDFRLWVRDEIDAVDAALTDAQAAFIEKAEAWPDLPMPGFTHLQNGQPVAFGHHMLAYVEMLGRDRGRFADARRRLNESPLGAAALAGTPFPIDRDMTAAALGFDRPAANSMDAVSDRDFALEFLAAGAITALHLSRFAEELVLWTSAQFCFVHLSDAFTTGSSIMPQKRNPDAAELVRAKPGRLLGAFTALATVLKGLPLTYGKDMQEDKEATFEAADSLMLAIAAAAGMARDMKPNKARLRAAAELGHPTATDLADWMVRRRGLPFRDAHRAAGALVAEADRRGLTLAQLPLDAMQAVEAEIDESVYDVLSIEKSIAARTSYGGTAPDNVRRAAAAARERFL
ncbi:MAG: argininosuccinate lyase [Alphaproteobacteria bacterium]|nr:argininosuccinate lyase [Alphaproteobacteria bacterium]